MQAIQRRASNTTREVVESANTRKIESEEEMHQDKPSSRLRILVPTLAALIAVSAAVIHVGLARAQSNAPATPLTDSDLVAQFRHVEVASVSDALEQITHKKMYMTHHMQPIFTSKFAGFARTVQLKKDEGNSDPEALSGMLEAIDQGSTDSVYVMVVEDGEDIAGMGGLMGTAMAVRGYSGAVIDGGVRDVAYLRKIAFPVFATGIVPSTSVHHYKLRGLADSAGMQRGASEPGRYRCGRQRWRCCGPEGTGEAVLTMAQQMDYKEHSMYALIEQWKSIVQAVKKVGRL